MIKEDYNPSESMSLDVYKMLLIYKKTRMSSET